MMEPQQTTQSIPEALIEQMMEIAHGAVLPILECQETLIQQQQQQQRQQEGTPTDDELRESLGLPPLLPKEETEETTATDSVEEDKTHSAAAAAAAAELLLDNVLAYCRERLNDVPMRLFGYQPWSPQAKQKGRMTFGPWPFIPPIRPCSAKLCGDVGNTCCCKKFTVSS